MTQSNYGYSEVIFCAEQSYKYEDFSKTTKVGKDDLKSHVRGTLVLGENTKVAFKTLKIDYERPEKLYFAKQCKTFVS